MTTLADMRNFMLSQIDRITIKNDEYYDEDGHCGDTLYAEIRAFWERFETDKDFEYLVSGRWASDELDLSGGRSYLLSYEKLVDMVFDYMSNTLKWSESDYDDRIWNTIDFTEKILDKYNNMSATAERSIEEPTEIKEDTSNDFIVMKYPNSMKAKLDTIDIFEFIGNSKIDDGVIYKISIPKGGKIIEKIGRLCNSFSVSG
jgi:hypothetical protein